jgi:head-tail adaptor
VGQEATKQPQPQREKVKQAHEVVLRYQQGVSAAMTKGVLKFLDEQLKGFGQR